MQTDVYDVVREVVGVAATPATAAQRAEALLAPIGRLVPFVAARLYLLDMTRRGEHPLVCLGYDDRMMSFLDSPRHMDELELLGLGRHGPPLRLRDMPVAPERISIWAEYHGPAGFREGMTVRLTTPDGRYLGILGLSTDSADHPTDAARNLLGALAPTIATAVDPLRSVSMSARLVRGATAGVLLARDGSTEPVPGLRGHPALAAGSPLLKVAVDQLKGAARASFLYPCDSAGGTDHLYVTTLACPALPPRYVTAAVVISTARDLRGLTRRELEVLGLLIEGYADRRIARTLQMTERTAHTHLEHIRAKLATRSRTLAAVHAVRQGLYIPPSLTVGRARAEWT